MEINWIFLVASSLILWIPATWFYPASGKEWLEQSRHARFRLERMLETWQNWLDLARALGGTYFLMATVAEIEWGVRDATYWAPATIAAVLGVGVVFQTIHFRKDCYFTAPAFYLWGVTLMLVPWPVAVFAILFSASLGRLANQVELKLFLLAALVGVTGFLINGFSFELLVAILLSLLPVIIALGAQKHLVAYSADLALK